MNVRDFCMFHERKEVVVTIFVHITFFAMK